MTIDQTDSATQPDDDLRIHRVAQRARYDRDAVNEIVDAALVAHVGTVRAGRPVVIPNKELRQTAVLQVPLDHASTKIRNGPPGDDEDDYAWPVWAGVVPIRTTYGEPEPDPRLSPEVGLPAHVSALGGKRL